jgi:hypothetical protein
MRVSTMRDANIDARQSRHVVREGSDQLSAAAAHPFS